MKVAAQPYKRIHFVRVAIGVVGQCQPLFHVERVLAVETFYCSVPAKTATLHGLDRLRPREGERIVPG